VDFVRNQRQYENLCIPYNSRFESRHGRVHTAIGGHMNSLTCAPSDCLFFLYHASVDYYFSLFLQRNRQVTYPTRGLRTNQRARSAMEPFTG